MIDQERIAKLPKWAQQYINKLQRDVEWYKEQLRQTSSGDSPIAWDSSTILESEWHGIPARATVRFEVLNGIIECQLRKGTLQIRKYRHHGRLVMMSQAYNAVEIGIVPEENFKVRGIDN